MSDGDTEPSADARDDSARLTNGFERLGGVVGILASGWVWEFLVTGICHGYWLGGSASCCAAPFWMLAILWAAKPSRRGLLLSGPLTFGLVANAYGRVDLRSDAQAGIALVILLLPVPVVSALAYWVGLVVDRGRQ